MRTSRIQLIPLFKGLPITTNGTAESKSYLALNVAAVTNLLPHCEALFLMTMMEGVADDIIDWNVSCWSGFDRNHELPTAFDIASANISAAGSARSSDYTTTSKFLPEARLELWWQNHTSVSGVKTAHIGAILGARLYGT